jgi:hypothetical protein
LPSKVLCFPVAKPNLKYLELLGGIFGKAGLQYCLAGISKSPWLPAGSQRPCKSIGRFRVRAQLLNLVLMPILGGVYLPLPLRGSFIIGNLGEGLMSLVASAGQDFNQKAGNERPTGNVIADIASVPEYSREGTDEEKPNSCPEASRLKRFDGLARVPVWKFHREKSFFWPGLFSATAIAALMIRRFTKTGDYSPISSEMQPAYPSPQVLSVRSRRSRSRIQPHSGNPAASAAAREACFSASSHRTSM